jgi:hypothetical protein
MVANQKKRAYVIISCAWYNQPTNQSMFLFSSLCTELTPCCPHTHTSFLFLWLSTIFYTLCNCLAAAAPSSSSFLFSLYLCYKRSAGLVVTQTHTRTQIYWYWWFLDRLIYIYIYKHVSASFYINEWQSSPSADSTHQRYGTLLAQGNSQSATAHKTETFGW